MCLVQSVGLNGANQSADVRLIQILLNENLGRMAPLSPLVIDGRMSRQTQDMIAAFELHVPSLVSSPAPSPAKPAGLVDPGGPVLQALRSGMSAGLTMDKLRGIMAAAGGNSIQLYYQPLVAMMRSSQINTPLRIAHFLAQLGHESGDLRYAEELADGSAYEGRLDLGNTQPGDGPRFKGRGLIQLTGRANYTAYGTARSQDFVSEPNYLKIATDAKLAVDVACWYWTRHGLNELADADDIKLITQKINGGYNGLADRQAHLQRAKCLLVL